MSDKKHQALRERLSTIGLFRTAEQRLTYRVVQLLHWTSQSTANAANSILDKTPLATLHEARHYGKFLLQSAQHQMKHDDGTTKVKATVLHPENVHMEQIMEWVDKHAHQYSLRAGSRFSSGSDTPRYHITTALFTKAGE